MKKHLNDPDQITLPILEPLFGQPPKKPRYQPCKVSRRREHAGAPAVGIDFGFDYGEAGEADAQGYVEVHNVVPIIFFNYEEVYQHMDGEHGEDAKSAIIALAADALAAMLNWVQEEFVSPGSDIVWNQERVIRCKLALIQLYRSPASLGNPTLEQLGNRLGVSKQKLDLLWADFKKKFGVKAAWEKTEAAKAAYRAAHGDN
jgi:hypothetical protein